jgi:hypothetical protein
MAFPTISVLDSGSITRTVNSLPNAGQNAKVDSLSVVQATDDPLVVGLGAPADSSATSDTGTFSLIALVKRALGYLSTIASNASSTAPSAVVGPGEFETVAASQTDQVIGATGAVGDYISHLLVIPTSTSPGAVSIKDGAGSAITVFAGGASALSNLVPFPISLGLTSLAGAWKVTTGTGLSVIAVGNFT